MPDEESEPSGAVDSVLQSDEDDSETPPVTKAEEAASPKRQVTAAVREEEQDDEQTPSLSGLRLGWCQIRAMLYKNALTKLRTPASTFLEIFTPCLMMLILVAAFSLSEVTYRQARSYATVRLDVPGPWMDLAVQAWELKSETTPNDAVRRNLVEERRFRTEAIHDHPNAKQILWDEWYAEFDELPKEIKGFGAWQLPLNLEESTLFPSKSNRRNRRMQVEDEDELDDDGFVNGKEGEQNNNVYRLLADARREIKRLLRNPLFVPSFAQYVSVSRAIRTLVNADEMPRVLSDSSYGRQWGNLLTLGTLHLSPASSNVTQAFGAYLQETYPLLFLNQEQEDAFVKMQWHESEEAALKYVDENLDERTWAVIDMSDWLDQAETTTESPYAHFKIRMNYTTLPNTNEIIDFVTIGLNTEYQQYYLSGYLTLQRTLNEFAFAYFGGDCVETAAGVSDIWSMPMPTAAYSQNSFFLAVGYLLGLTIASE